MKTNTNVYDKLKYKQTTKNKTKTKMSVKKLACLKVKGTASEKDMGDRPCLVQL